MPKQRESSDPGHLLTAREVATRLGLHYETVRRLLQHGEIKALKFGNRGGWRVREEALEEYIKRMEQEIHKDRAA